MVARASKVVNVHEVGAGRRGSSRRSIRRPRARIVVDPAYLTESRVFVQVQGEGNAGQRRPSGWPASWTGCACSACPSGWSDTTRPPDADVGPALLPEGHPDRQPDGRDAGPGAGAGQPRGRRPKLDAAGQDDRSPRARSASVLDGPGLARALDHAVASAFVTVKPARRGSRSTTLKVENRLPFTLANVMIKAGGSSGSVDRAVQGRRCRPRPLGPGADPGPRRGPSTASSLNGL